MYIETDSRDAHAILERVLFALPVGLAREIRAVGGSRLGFPYGLCEIRLRRHGACTMLFYGESVRLLSGVCKEEITAFLDRVTEGSLYAYRTAIADGYVPLGAGVRLGVCGVAGYDGDRVSLTMIGPRIGCFGGRALIFGSSVHGMGDMVDGKHF